MNRSDVNTAGMAESHEILEWSQINWKAVNSTVVRFRRRIFRAARNGKWKKLRSLQRLFVSSDSNLLYSIRHVTYGSGRHTPGLDEVVYTTPQERVKAYNELKDVDLGAHRPLPVRRIYVPKPDGRMRPIGIPTIKDRIIQSVIKNALEPEWESKFEGSSYGFRPSRSVNDAINRIYVTLNKPGSRVWVLDADISQCFDSISHEYLREQYKHFPYSGLIDRWLDSGITVGAAWLQTVEGTPQGSILSPLLCNIALHGLEQELGIRTINSKGHLDPKGRSIVRYADDFAVFSHSKQQAHEALDLVKEALKKRGLEISEAKTRIVHTAEGFDFLGFNIRYRPRDGSSPEQAIRRLEDGDYLIDYERTGLYIYPSTKSIKNVKNKLKEVFVKSRNLTTRDFIISVNSVIRGWANSKRAWHSTRTFHDLDHHLFNLQWSWMRRKHPNKNTGWMKDRYFRHIKQGLIDNRWVFTDPISSQENPVFMYQFKWLPVEDHVMVQNSRNPDNPDDKSYWIEITEKRANNKKFSTLSKLDMDLSTSQDHICPICSASLYNGEELHRHHLIEFSKGGTFTFGNILILHLPCHYQVHSARGSRKEQLNSLLLSFKESHPRISTPAERAKARENAKIRRERKRKASDNTSN